jgi:predicted ATPase
MKTSFSMCNKPRRKRKSVISLFPRAKFKQLLEKNIPSFLKNEDSISLTKSEHRNVVVMYVDLLTTGTSITGQDAELLLTRILQIIYRYEAIVKDSRVKGIAVLFGALRRHEDDEDRAIHASFEVMRAGERFNEEHGTDVSINIGIHRGVISLSHIDTMHTVHIEKGQDVITKTRQLTTYADRTIVISNCIKKKIMRRFDVISMPRIPKYIKRSHIYPYVIKGERQQVEPKHGNVPFYAPLVGRDREFRILRAGLDEVNDNRCVLFFIHGEAGVGKSRLIDEFRKTTIHDVVWLAGRCQSYGVNSPFSVFLEQIRSYLGIAQSDFDEVSEKKLVDKTQHIFKKRIGNYLPYLSIFLSIRVLRHMNKVLNNMGTRDLDPQSLRLQEYISIKELIRDIAYTKSLVLYFEDIQWIDSESADLLAYLLDGLHEVPVMFIFEARSEKNVTNQICRQILKRSHHRIDLEVLTEKNARKLVRYLMNVRKPPRSFITHVVHKSQGNPFYIEELIHSFIDSGMFKRTANIWRLTKDIASSEIPDTIEAIIQSRIDQLSSTEKVILNKASVIGMKFPFQVLKAMNGTIPVRNILDMLEYKDFIRKVVDHGSPDRYTFKHGLVQSVAYAKLPLKQKAMLHRKAAHCYELMFKKKLDDYYEIIAYHLHQGANLKKAYKYYEKAGNHALSCYSNNTAISCYTNAIDIYKKLISGHKNEHIAELYMKRGDACMMIAQYAAALKDYHNAYKASGNIVEKARQKYKAGHSCFVSGDYDNALSYLKKAMDMLKKHSTSPIFTRVLIDYTFLLLVGRDNRNVDKIVERTLAKIDKKREMVLYAHCLNSLANIYRINDCYEKALTCHRKALAIYKEMNDLKNIALVSNHIGIVYQKMGDLNKALEYFITYYELSKKIGNINNIFGATNNISLVYCQKGDYTTALRYRKSNLRLAEEIGYRKTVGFAAYCAGNTYSNQKRFETALIHYKRYHAISKEINDVRGLGIACLSIGSCYAELKEFQKAKQHLSHSARIFKKTGKRKRIDACVTLSQLYAAQNDYVKARVYARRAINVARELNGKPHEIIALRNMAAIISKQSLPKAREYLERSVLLANELKMMLESAESLLCLAKVYKSMQKNESAVESARDALEQFIALGADSHVEKTKKFIKSCKKERIRSASYM